MNIHILTQPYLPVNATSGLVSSPQIIAMLPLERLEAPVAGAEERLYRQLWTRFYDTVAIEGRYNPRCRMTQMPKRYWAMMTEFQPENQAAALPENAGMPFNKI